MRLTAGHGAGAGQVGLTALFGGGDGWYAYAPLADTPQATPTGWKASAALPVSESGRRVRGTLALGGAWVLLPGGRAATIDGPGAAVAAAAAGAGQHSGARLRARRRGRRAGRVRGDADRVAARQGSTVWSEAQTISVPIQYGSSS